MPRSTAYVVCTDYNYTYHFSGVTSIDHNLALNIGNDASQGGDIINGAKNIPDQVTLSVIETDVSHSPGWSKKMLEAMVSLKKNRYLCKVVTAMGTYNKMLLTEISITEDAENSCGWSGELVFMQYVKTTSAGKASDTSSGGKTNDNTSSRRSTGTKASATTVVGEALKKMLGASTVSFGSALFR